MTSEERGARPQVSMMDATGAETPVSLARPVRLASDSDHNGRPRVDITSQRHAHRPSEGSEERQMNSPCALLQIQSSSRPTPVLLCERAQQRAFSLPRRDER